MPRSSLAAVLLAFALPAGAARVPSVDELTVEEKVGQLLMVIVENGEENEQREAIETGRLGGALIFLSGEDQEAVRKKTSQVQDWARKSRLKIPFLFAVDREGGPFFTSRSEGATLFPGNMAIGATGAELNSYTASYFSARELRAMGVQMNFAPVLDVNTNPDNPIIGVRSFGEDPALVGKLGAASVRGYQKAGVAAVAKHYPGHGDTHQDSHEVLPILDHDLARLRKVDLPPFEEAIKTGVHGIMVAHIAVPALDSVTRPASLSPKVIGALKKRSGFKGVVVTDSLDMSGITNNYTVDEAAELALAAGADILLIGRSSRKTAFRRLVRAVNSGDVPMARLNDAVGRVLALKQELGMFNGRRAGLERPLDASERKRYAEVAQGIADASITSLGDAGNRLPAPLDGKVVLVLFAPKRFKAELLWLSLELQKKIKNLRTLLLPPNPSWEDRREILTYASGADRLIIGTYYWGDPEPEQIEVVRLVADSLAPTVLVSMMNPYDLAFYPKTVTRMATYGITPATMRALSKILAGEGDPRGSLPITLPTKAEFPAPKPR